MTMRRKGYDDYSISKEEAVKILEYCSSENANLGVILKCAMESNKTIGDLLFKSVTQRKSYEKLGYVPITKNDFYGYRRKMIWLIYKEMEN